MKLSNRYPLFFRQSPAISSARKIQKSFSTLGLKDCRGIVKSSFKTDSCNLFIYHLYSNFTYDPVINPIILEIKDPTKNVITNNYAEIDIKKGETFQSALDKILIFSKSKPWASQVNFEKSAPSKIKDLLTEKKYKIVFSTKTWDIATMSMRGIDSCMNWTSPHSRHLIGSTLDPYAGVIYLTDGKKTKRGIKMLYRAVVRVVRKRQMDEKIPYLFIDKIYSYNKEIKHQLHPEAMKVFQNFLTEKISSSKKFAHTVLTYPSGTNSLYIPLDKKIHPLSKNYRSCVDSGIPYGATVEKIY